MLCMRILKKGNEQLRSLVKTAALRSTIKGLQNRIFEESGILFVDLP
jgi:hypothetical protein